MVELGTERTSLAITRRRTSSGKTLQECLNPEKIEKLFIEVDNVRITPAALSFLGAYDGKKFVRKFKITNVGRHCALVRVFAPTSEAFVMKPSRKGVTISPGLSLTKKISYTCNSATALPQIYISIYINEKPILYEIRVQLSFSYVRIVPKMLHFGEIDIGTSTERLSLKLINEGQRNAHFSVDLGNNDLELIVDPMRGTIKPKETVEVKVEILGSRQGKFLKEFWIKTEPLQRIWLTGTFISPKLKIEHPFSNFDLIVIDFPKAYYKVQNSRILIIRNSSSTNTMFCTVAEYQKCEEIKLEEARNLDQNLRFFNIVPTEGRLMKNQNAAITITFAPYRLKTFPQKYAIFFIKILKINYRDGLVKENDISVKTFPGGTELEQYQIAGSHSQESIYDLSFENSISFLRICLYGEMEEANVKLTPHSIDRQDLNVNQTYNLTFNIANLSIHLPITYKYEKVACFKMDPSEATLKPASSIDVLLILKPCNMGHVQKKLNLSLYYTNRDGKVFKVGNASLHVDYSAHIDVTKPSLMLQPKFVMGITSPYISDVGYNVGNVRYNNVDASKLPVAAFVNQTKMINCTTDNNSDLIAFPNDRPKGNYPWRNEVPCTTIFAHLPRHIEPKDYTYTKTSTEVLFKAENKKLYTEFAKKLFEKKVTPFNFGPENAYYPTSLDKVLLLNEPIRGCLLPFVEEEKAPKFIPLNPQELMAIEITPRYIMLGQIAPHIICSDFFEIKNKNNFPVVISIFALSNSLLVKGKQRLTIHQKESAKLYFDCYSHGLGKYYVPLYIIINDHHIFDATVFAHVVPTTVRCKFKEITITAKENVSYLELYNPVNCAIDFAWDVQEEDYEIVPKNGKIESRKTLYCKVIFHPRIDAVFKTDVFLLSQSGAKQIVRVCYERMKTNIKFSSWSIEMKSVPLNIMINKHLVVRNDANHTVVIYVRNPNPIEEINISPKQALIQGKGDIFFKISALFKAIKTFSCTLEFISQEGREYKVEVVGNVAYPNISLEPQFMHIPKIITDAYQRRVFRITNLGLSVTTIRFLLDFYPDLSVTDLYRRPIKDEITLSSKDYIELYLEFQPKEPTAYTLYLPILVNNLVGPPLLNNPNSFRIGTYLVPPAPDFSKTMATLKITCAAGAAWFKFSSLMLNFADGTTVTREFTVKNISSVFHKIKFKVDGLNSHFGVDVTDCSGNWKRRNEFIKASLEPGDSVQLCFSFNPEEYGVYEEEVQIFVTDYFENCPFNYIRLRGTKDKPLIAAKNRMVNMPTIPVGKSFTKTVSLELKYHKQDCVVSVENDQEFLKIEVKQELDRIDLTVSFLPKIECNLVSDIFVTCTCDATCTLCVAAEADNCSLLSYRHKMKWWFDSTTSTNDRQENYQYTQNNEHFVRNLNRLNEILEKYVYSQGFFSTYFFQIPETISKYPFSVYTSAEKKSSRGPVSGGPPKNKVTHLPIVMFFKNLTNASVVLNLTDGINSASVETRQGTVYDYGVYKNVLKYLEDYGVFVKNLCPELLLCYERYIYFKTQLIDNSSLTGDEILSEDEFNFLSKQCWLDLILKTYKLLHYDRLLKHPPPKTGKLEIEDIYQVPFQKYLNENLDLFPSDMNQCEAKLMLWLEFHFLEQKDKLWPDKNVAPRKIRDLSRDVKDSLPLATLMTAYCPYLVDVFKEMYFEDTDKISTCLLHNSCLVSEAWNRLELSFKISTNSIFEPINTEMIFLLSYLRVVLPYFYPKETITIKSYLGQTSANKIVLKNSGSAGVSYTGILFLNDNESFKIEPKVIALAPKGEKEVLVSYTAKQIIKEEAVLVLSGETGSQKLSKSIAVNLIGIPDILFFTQECRIKADLYSPVTKKIEVKSPYMQSYQAATYFYLFEEDKPPLTMKDFVSVSTLPGLPRQLQLEGACTFDNEGNHKLVVQLCFISFGEWIYYIYFTNKEVGVFCIKITVTTYLPFEIYESIPIRIQLNFDPQSVCKCKPNIRNHDCPRIIYADIPVQNKNLLEGLRKMIKIYAKPNEVEFWNTHLVFPKAFHIFRSYLQHTFDDYLVPFKRVLDPAVTFRTFVEEKKFSAEDVIRFDDVSSEGTYKLMLHWDSSEFPENEKLYLIAEHGYEARYYELKFWTREPRTNNIYK